MKNTKRGDDASYEEVMADKAVTNISGWTEPNEDRPCDEKEYRKRLHEQASDYHKKVAEALSFE